MIHNPPRTILEVFESLPEGTLCQLIHNQIIMSPSPQPDHQKVARNIFRQLDRFVEQHQLGETFFAPLDVYLDRENIFQPDILFISTERLHIIGEKIIGAPDLIIEILSPGTSRYDQQQKKQVYEQAGVKELWLVNPKTKAVEGYFLEEMRFLKIAAETGIIQSRLLGVTISF